MFFLVDKEREIKHYSYLFVVFVGSIIVILFHNVLFGFSCGFGILWVEN